LGKDRELGNGKRRKQNLTAVAKSTVVGNKPSIRHCSFNAVGSRLMNALNINSCHSPTKFLQPANLTTYTILPLFSLQV